MFCMQLQPDASPKKSLKNSCQVAISEAAVVTSRSRVMLLVASQHSLRESERLIPKFLASSFDIRGLQHGQATENSANS
jgi:hypothetical protein